MTMGSTQHRLFIPRHRILRLVDRGDELIDNVQVGRVHSFEDLERVIAEQQEWVADVSAFAARYLGSDDLEVEHAALPAAMVVDEDQSRGDAIRLLQATIRERIRFLGAVLDRCGV